MAKHRCARCGKISTRVHKVANQYVCADDRLCYPKKKGGSKNAKN